MFVKLSINHQSDISHPLAHQIRSLFQFLIKFQRECVEIDFFKVSTGISLSVDLP